MLKEIKYGRRKVVHYFVVMIPRSPPTGELLEYTPAAKEQRNILAWLQENFPHIKDHTKRLTFGERLGVGIDRYVWMVHFSPNEYKEALACELYWA